MLSPSRLKSNVPLFETADHLPYIHRDISWLSFNYRVLQEAMDTTVPLFERIKFLAIYSSNLDEFFRVRMANHRNLLRVGKKTKRELETPPKMVVREIQHIVNKQQQEFSRILEKQIVPELRKHGIYLLRRLDLEERQKEFVEGSARVAALMLRANMPDSDRAMHLAGELIGVGCGLLEWADYAPCASVDKMRAENLQAVAGFVAARAQELRS